MLARGWSNFSDQVFVDWIGKSEIFINIDLAYLNLSLFPVTSLSQNVVYQALGGGRA